MKKLLIIVGLLIVSSPTFSQYGRYYSPTQEILYGDVLGDDYTQVKTSYNSMVIIVSASQVVIEANNKRLSMEVLWADNSEKHYYYANVRTIEGEILYFSMKFKGNKRRKKALTGLLCHPRGVVENGLFINFQQ